jgi:hypothetical protein
LQITLPLLFCALLLVSVMLWTTTSEGLVRSEDVLALAHIWEQPADLLVAGAMQMVALSLLSLLKSAPR